MATAMYFAECDATGKPLKVAKSDNARMRQHYILMPNRDSKAENKVAKFAKNSKSKKNFKLKKRKIRK